ncbi:hypothetical protein GCM10012275_40040 [Longimycelium tulufanense]|uniref:Uncharacterized protein n=1 Tax=Longimycelium tulufanense TaxID=907463 RepID=A0A8J3FV68_9PSEU|nr:hypothetical protein GCM10012275_40040 [Longimycelium tulufanense]
MGQRERQPGGHQVGTTPRTVCHRCGGEGQMLIQRHAVIGGVGRTATVFQDCPDCDNTGKLKGLVPPL